MLLGLYNRCPATSLCFSGSELILEEDKGSKDSLGNRFDTYLQNFISNKKSKGKS